MDDHLADAAQVQPLRGEIVDERAGGAGVGQHAPHLLFENRRTGELSALGEVEQALVGNAAPQEERQARRDFQIAQALRQAEARLGAPKLAGRSDCERRLGPMDAQQEVGIDEHAFERELNAGVEAPAVAPAAVEELEQRLDVGVRHRTAIGEPRDPRKNLRGARLLLRRELWAGRRRSRGGWGCPWPFRLIADGPPI